MFVILLMGFYSGLPFALSGSTFQAWLTDSGVDLSTIGFLSALSLPYAFKFLWAPVLDRFPAANRRRVWMVIAQLGLALVIFLLSFLSPGPSLAAIAVLVFLLSFFSATQDIAIDAYRREVLGPEELGLGASVGTLGYRLGMIASGAGALLLADHVSWSDTLRIFALLTVLALPLTHFAPEPEAPHTDDAGLLAPFRELLARPYVAELLLFVALYKLGDLVATALNVPFFRSLGFSKSDIAYVQKTLGLIATILGGLAGGALMSRLTLRTAILGFGILQGVACLGYALLVPLRGNMLAFSVVVTVEQFCFGAGTAAFLAFLMTITDKRYSGTQYALLTGLLGLVRSGAGMFSGWFSESYGWGALFVVSALLSVPGLVLVYVRFEKWSVHQHAD